MQDAGVLPKRKVYSSDLSAHTWQRLEPLLLAHVRRRSKWPLLELVNAILLRAEKWLFMARPAGGVSPWGTVYCYFSKWQRNGVLDKINAYLVVDYRESAQKKRSPPAS